MIFCRFSSGHLEAIDVLLFQLLLLLVVVEHTEQGSSESSKPKANKENFKTTISKIALKSHSASVRPPKWHLLSINSPTAFVSTPKSRLQLHGGLSMCNTPSRSSATTSSSPVMVLEPSTASTLARCNTITVLSACVLLPLLTPLLCRSFLRPDSNLLFLSTSRSLSIAARPPDYSCSRQLSNHAKSCDKRRFLCRRPGNQRHWTTTFPSIFGNFTSPFWASMLLEPAF